MPSGAGSRGKGVGSRRQEAAIRVASVDTRLQSGQGGVGSQTKGGSLFAPSHLAFVSSLDKVKRSDLRLLQSSCVSQMLACQKIRLVPKMKCWIQGELLDLRQQVKTMEGSIEELQKSILQSESKLMDFKQWLHETKQQLQEANWREKSLTDDLAAVTLREESLQRSVAEMDATIMQLEEANNNLSSQSDMRRRQLEKCNADLVRTADDVKSIKAHQQETEKKLVLNKSEYDKTMKEKTIELLTALSAVEQIHTVICQVRLELPPHA